MKVLIDECLPRKLKRHLLGHEASTVPEMGWAGVKNGALLRLAEPVFDVFLTIDNNMQRQQNLYNLQISVVVLTSPDNTMDTLQTLIPSLLETLSNISPGRIMRISI